MRKQIDVYMLEFDEGGNTIWIHNQAGATILRVKTEGMIVVNKECTNPYPHADIITPDCIQFCIPDHENSTL